MFALFYPPLCYACSRPMRGGEHGICTRCSFVLPQTHFHRQQDNRLVEMFWGRAHIQTATALFYYQKGGLVQNLIHRFKYKDMKQIGSFLGHWMGGLLKDAPSYAGLDVIVPVPLHPRRQKQRGFNQSEVLSHAMGAAMGLPVSSEALRRAEATSTQTRKSRFRRWENVSGAFVIHRPGELENKGILLVDDVVTTGSTLEACANVLLSVKGVRVCLAAIAAAL